MSNLISVQLPNSMPNKAECSVNHKVGKRVDSLILKSLLTLPINLISYKEYYFCPDPDCPVVYYSTDNKQIFTEDDLRVRVFQKHQQDNDVLVCYCFKHNVGNIRKDVTENQKSTIVEQINHDVQANLCACGILNPQASCCLGNIRKLIKDTQPH